jgi:hypothetical protein
MNKNLLIKLSLYILCGVTLLLGFWTIYRVYVLEKEHKEIVDKIVGKQPLMPDDEIFVPLIKSLENRYAPIVQGLPKELGTYNIKYLKDSSTTLPLDDTWISYKGLKAAPINYSAVNFYKSYDILTATNTVPPKTQPSKSPQPVNGSKTRTKPVQNALEDEATKKAENSEKFEKYAFDVVLSGLVNECMVKQIHNYPAYSETAWEYLFGTRKNRYLDVGKVFVATKSSYAVFPYRTKEYNMTVSTRDWWNAAYYVSDDQHKQEDFYDLISNSRNTGLTHIYSDIVSNEGLTDLNRTLWFKFNNAGKDFVLGIDLRLSDFSFNIFNEVFYEIVLLAICFPLLGILFYLNQRQSKREIESVRNIDRIYKISRIGRQEVTYNAGQPKLSEFTSKVSIVHSQENIVSNQSSWQFNLDAKSIKASTGGDKRNIHSTTNSELIEITIKKPFDLSLKTGSLKAVELWKVSRPNNENYAIGIIEVLWQNNRNTNDITFNQVYWDSNTSASYTDILKELKKHLQTRESKAFIVDQSSEAEDEPEVINQLKNNVDSFKDFTDKFESFNNRVLVFENNVPFLKEIYSNNNSNFFATCSIEFLDNLQRQGSLKEILSLKINIRYIIDGETRKFTDFYKGLNTELKEFILSLPNLKIIAYKASLETIYLNRDFCIMSFGEHKCVLYTDMSDERAQKGWISWRAVDIKYYDAIREYIESGDVQKKGINAYLGKG